MSKTPKLTYKIRIDEVDNSQFLTVPNLAKYLQEVAWEASVLVENSVNDLRANHLTWVLSRLQLEMLEYPQYTDKVTFETWGSSSDKYFVYRDFRIFNEKQNLIGRAISSWLIVDIRQGKMISMPESVVSAFIVENGESMSMDKVKIPSISKIIHDYSLKVRWSDLDLNQHSNNTHYYRWAMDSLPVDILKEKQIKYLDIQFKAESKLGDDLVVRLDQQDECFVYQIFNQSTQKECVRMRTVFR